MRQVVTIILLKDLGEKTWLMRELADEPKAYRGEFRWCRDIFKRTNTITYLTDTFFLLLTVQFRIDSIDKSGHFMNLNKQQRACRWSVSLHFLTSVKRVKWRWWVWSCWHQRRPDWPLLMVENKSLSQTSALRLTISWRSLRCWLSWVLFCTASSNNLYCVSRCNGLIVRSGNDRRLVKFASIHWKKWNIVIAETETDASLTVIRDWKRSSLANFCLKYSALAFWSST